MSISLATIHQISQSRDRSGKDFALSTGKLATQADGSIVVSIGQTSILVTTCMDIKADKDKDFLPLMIENRELYSATRKI